MTRTERKQGRVMRSGYVGLVAAGMSGLPMLLGCQAGMSKAAGSEFAVQISGDVSAAAQAVSGANIQLFAAGESGDGSASQPLLASPIASNSKGQFAVGEHIRCASPTSQVYLVADGGRPASLPSGNNPGMSAMTMLGACEDLASGIEVDVNEETTVGAIWSMARFMRSATEIGSAAGDTAIAEAAAKSKSVVDVSDGLAVTDGAMASTQTKTVNALANLLSTCMNSNGGKAGDGSACGTLFTLTTEQGDAPPTNTIDAALHIAKNPALQVAALYRLSEHGSSFHPVLSSAPEDWTLPTATASAIAGVSAEARAKGAVTVMAENMTGNVTGSPQTTLSQTPVPATYFGMTVQGTTSTPVSAIQYGTTRSWDARPGVSWADINTSAGVYNFSGLDSLLAVNAQRGTDVVYVFGRTPQWASSKKATAGSYGVGQCAPPASLADWDNFVRALATHAKGKIKYWEFWDEPNNPGTWCGDMTTFVTMAAHASQILKSIDPNAVLFSPTLTSTSGPAWLDWYLNSGGGAYADAIAFHGYWSTTAEDINTVVAKYRAVMAKYGQSSKALWDTEVSWAGDGDLPTPSSANQVGFVAKEYLLNWSLGVSRAVWYAYDGGNVWGGLWTSAAGASPTAKAYSETYRWMVGATLTAPCSEDSNGNWMCSFTRPNGYQARAMWNSTRPYGVTVPAQFVEYRDLAGVVHSVVRNNVLLGNQPVLVETSPLPN